MGIVLSGLSMLSLALNTAAIVSTAALAIIGLIQVITTRADAFTVLDRQQQNWLLLLGGAIVAAILGNFPGLEMLWIIGAVIVGIYWQDVRPSIKDVLDNAGGTW